MAGQDWEVTSEPPDHLKVSLIPQKIRDLKSATKTVMQVEHVALGAGVGGQHLKGAARVYLSDGMPSLDPESNNLDTTATSDDGRIAIATGGGASTGLTNTLKVYVATSVGISTGWEDVRVAYAGTAVRVELDNNAAILGRKSGAPTTTVDVIKVNANDVPQLLVGSVLSADTAPSTDVGIANKKYVDDQISANVPAALTADNNTAGTVDIGGLKLEWGKSSLTGNQDKVISTTGGFTKIFQVICSYQSSDNAITDSCSAYNYSSSGFNIVNSQGSGLTVSWLAIGR